MSKIRVGIFADDLARSAMGTALVLRRLLGEFQKSHTPEIDVVLIHKSETEFPVEFKKFLKVVVPKIHTAKFSGFFSYLRFFVTTRERFDIIHIPRPALHPFFWLLKLLGKTKKIIVTFHGAPDDDSIPIFETAFTKFNRGLIKHWGKYWIDSAIADSKTGREQIVRYYKLRREKTEVIYPGVDSVYHSLSDQERIEAQKKLHHKYGVASPYVLCVSRLDPHKNVHRTIEAFVKAKGEANFPHELIIVGSKHEPVYSHLVEETVKRLQAEKFIKIIPFVEEIDLPCLYAASDFFIFASLSEGFGLPLVEAMASGIPAITSDRSCLPEIAGGAALLVDPYNIIKIAETIRTLASVRTEVRHAIAERGQKRASEFKWETTAQKTANLYRSVANT